MCLVARNAKHKNRSNIATNSIKTLKMVHIKKNLINKKIFFTLFIWLCWVFVAAQVLL